MAVQQNKKSPSRRNMRRAHQSLRATELATDNLGNRHVRHHVSDSGHYRGRQIVAPKKSDKEE